jgi:hypothetical protein
MEPIPDSVGPLVKLPAVKMVMLHLSSGRYFVYDEHSQTHVSTNEEMVARMRYNKGYPMCCGVHAYMDEAGIPLCMQCGTIVKSCAPDQQLLLSPADQREGRWR